MRAHKTRGLRVCLVALSALLASAMPASQIFNRRDTCASQKLDSCSSNLPDNFCCPSGSTCVALAGDTTALCCPTSNGHCDLIQPITCDVSRQDADKFPSAPIKTSVMDVDLVKCGSDTCCPFGYSCTSSGGCQKKKDQSLKPGQKRLPSSSSSSSASSTTATTSQQAPSSTVVSDPTKTIPANTVATTGTATSSTSTSSSTSDPQPEHASSNSASKTSIAGGVVAGCLILFIVIILIYLYVRRSNRRHDAESQRRKPQMRHQPSGSCAGQVISGPIGQPDSYRTDFIRKNASTNRNDVEDTDSMHSSASLEANGAAALDSKPQKRRSKMNIYQRGSIPNPFSSPNPSHALRSPGSRTSLSSATSDDGPPRHGHVGAKLAPIRAMKASSKYARRSHAPQFQIHRDPSSENINIFADPGDLEDQESGEYVERNITRKPVPLPLPVKIHSEYGNQRLTRDTTFSDLMDQADLGGIHNGRSKFVPGTTPRL